MNRTELVFDGFPILLKMAIFKRSGKRTVPIKINVSRLTKNRTNLFKEKKDPFLIRFDMHLKIKLEIYLN